MYSVIFALQMLVIVALLAGTVYVLFANPSKTQLQVLIMMISTMIMMIGYVVEIASETESRAMLGAQISYIGKPFVMLSSFLFLATLCGVTVARWMKITLSVFSATISAIVLTNDYHHLYYATVTFDPGKSAFSGLILTRGPLYYLYMLEIFTFMLVDLIIVLREIKKCRTKSERQQVFYLLGLVASGVLGYVLYILGVTGGYDSTMAGVTVSTFLLFVLFFRYRLLDIVTVAKDLALNDATGGLLVWDTHERVVYTNACMTSFLKENPTFTDNETLPGESIYKNEEKVYSIKRRDIEKHEYRYGTVVEVNDITDSYRYAARLEADVKARADEILHIQRSVIGSFANFVEARNGETGSHIKRTGKYVEILARGMKELGLYTDVLTEEYIDRLVDAAPLHDIGKIVVSDSILMKPGKLTKEEFDEMKKHAAAGVDVIEKTMRGVESAAYVSMAEDVAHYHHEKWDGSGYPCGLAGTDIPLSARIMAVADVYDALRSERCYKKAMDKDSARRSIEEASGSHFDPSAVKAFVMCLKEIESVSADPDIQNDQERRIV